MPPVLNYCVTSNHIHLLVYDKDKNEIARSMQLIEGRMGQGYNIRKKREGAFWEERYNEIMNGVVRYRIIDRDKLSELLEIDKKIYENFIMSGRNICCPRR